MPLTSDLEASLHPVELGGLEEFGRLERSEEVLLPDLLLLLGVELVQDPPLQKLRRAKRSEARRIFNEARDSAQRASKNN